MNYFENERLLLTRDWLLKKEKEEPDFITRLLIRNERFKVEKQLLTKSYKEVNEDFKNYKELNKKEIKRKEIKRKSL